MSDRTDIPKADKTIDARGSFCPGPLLELIRGVKSVPVGAIVAVFSSDPGSNKDIPLWIEKASDIIEEYYASFTLDRAAKKHLGMVSAKGGVDIEAVAEEDPAAIARVHIDPLVGIVALIWAPETQGKPLPED